MKKPPDKIRSARVKIVNVKYKSVVRPKKFDTNDLCLDAKKALDELLDQVNKKPVAYFMCVFGDKRGEVYRHWSLPTTQDTISFAELPDILYNIALRG